MFNTAVSRRRLAAAVTVTLAVTLGATTLNAPAFAAPAAGTTSASASAEAATVFPFPRGAEITLAGSTGFLAGDGTWTRYSDGATFAHRGGQTPTGAPDLMASTQPFESHLSNAATGEVLFSLNTQIQGPIGEYVGAAGSAIFTVTTEKKFLMQAKTGDHITTTPVTGLPADATDVSFFAGDAAFGVVDYTSAAGGTAKKYRALVDLSTGALTAEVHEIPKYISQEVVVSEKLLVWPEGSDVVVTTRATGAQQRIPVTTGGRSLKVGLVGDWVTYVPAEALTPEGYETYPLTARNLTTGDSRTFLAHATSVAGSPDGSLLVRGGTVAQGEGVYRIALGADGIPASTLIASTGEATAAVPLELVKSTVPAVADLDRSGAFPLTWTFSREVFGSLEIEHKASHRRVGITGSSFDKALEFDLQQPFNEGALPNGDYTWKIEARPEADAAGWKTWTGTFKIARKSQPHDYNGNGSPDLLTRDSDGMLWRHEAGVPAKAIQRGWNVYDRIEAAGNLGGSVDGDIVGRDKDGVLWLHKGFGYFYGTFTNARVRIGSGWNAYTILAGGSDVTGDGKPDLLGVDRSGVLRVHTGTGNETAPFAPVRKSAGTGWGVYNEIAAVGNIAGGPAGDLVARDRSGVLWLHLGKGDGTFAPRTRIGGGWNAYTQLVGIGDANRDGRPDLIAQGASGTFLYKGTGNWKTPFTAPQKQELLGGKPPYNTIA
ncbi:VCBS repeat-containing protein [Streptomyces sp. TLI_105]|uniref:FG-GAP repeat domain-containing protein n=1 Tax=Streptomyces sp. TLI_105 TaxID=1881019 RepID=UPI00089C1184|nr:VCBS repeat-containing protein [Streptomyces sp. TLI_105]SEC76301.1 Repeat domain-containing protein [Streptomyces sp. TLI_105]